MAGNTSSSSGTRTSTGTTNKNVTSSSSAVRKRRKAPNPQNSILDRVALQEALDSAGISVKRLHMDAFYHSLHRQHYPPLPQFVETYYKNEQWEKGQGGGGEPHQKQQQQPQQEDSQPLPNKVSNRKNKNRTQLPKAFLEYLRTTKDFVSITSKIREQLTSNDQRTTKLIIELYDGQIVESVLMRYSTKGQGRASLCVSSQCGCAMGCTFCATGTLGLSGNLTSAEILEQLVHANSVLAKDYAVTSLSSLSSSSLQEQEDPNNGTSKSGNGKGKPQKWDVVRNVIFMGMGEPLDNYTNVVTACRAMIDRRRWNLAHGHVTVSTVGLVSQIRKLTQDLPEVNLALSLHAPNQAMRTAIVPTASRYPIESLIDALDGHMNAYVGGNKQQKRGGQQQQQQQQQQDGTDTGPAEERLKASSRRRAMIEYVMLQGDTSTFECAHQLGKLCENRQMYVNLIPYNATDVKDKLQCPSEQHMKKFRDIVASYGPLCTIRRTMGADIASACGQLVTKVEENDRQAAQPQKGTQSSSQESVRDIEDVLIPTNKYNPTNSKGFSKEHPTSSTTRTTISGSTSRSSSNSRDPNEQPAEPQVTEGKSFSLARLSSWLETIPTEDLNQWEQRLTIASTVAASCFIVSSLLLLRNQPRR